MVDNLVICFLWLVIILAWKSYKDKVIRYYKYRILYLEDRLRRNNIHYEDESKL